MNMTLGIATAAAVLALAFPAQANHWQPPALGPGGEVACFTFLPPGTIRIDARPERATLERGETRWFGVKVHSGLRGCPQYRDIEVCAKVHLRVIYGPCQVLTIESGHDRLTAFGIWAGRHEGRYLIRFTARLVYPDQ
jgi:hypothetical protein